MNEKALERQRLRADLLTAFVEAPTLLSKQDIAELTRTSKATIDRAIRQGTFPRPAVTFGMNGHRWLTRDYVAWCTGQAAAQSTERPRVIARRDRPRHG